MLLATAWMVLRDRVAPYRLHAVLFWYEAFSGTWRRLKKMTAEMRDCKYVENKIVHAQITARAGAMIEYVKLTASWGDTGLQKKLLMLLPHIEILERVANAKKWTLAPDVRIQKEYALCEQRVQQDDDAREAIDQIKYEVLAECSDLMVGMEFPTRAEVKQRKKEAALGDENQTQISDGLLLKPAVKQEVKLETRPESEAVAECSAIDDEDDGDGDLSDDAHDDVAARAKAKRAPRRKGKTAKVFGPFPLDRRAKPQYHLARMVSRTALQCIGVGAPGVCVSAAVDRL